MNVDEWAQSGGAWDEWVRRAPDSTVMHLHGWKTIMERSYGHRTFYLAARQGGEVRGVLPLTLVRNRILGDSLVSMPFMDYGGACTAGDEDAHRALVDEARAIAVRERAVLTLRNMREAPLDLPCSLDKVTMLLELGSIEDALWKRLPSERRNRIKKGGKLGVTASFPGAEGLGDFYRVFATNMRDLGSPVHAYRFFQEVLRVLPPAHARLIVVRADDQPIGAGLMLIHGGMISIPWVSSLRTAFDKCPNQVLYWEAMRFGLGEGHRLLDFGRSSKDSGTFEAKRQWRAEPHQLHWYYHPHDAPPPGEGVKRLGWVARVWRRLPVPVANAVGPTLRGGLPN